MKKNKRTYQWIADNYGDVTGLNHPSSVRKVFIDAMYKICKRMLTDTGEIKNFTDADVKRIANTVEFQEFVSNCYLDSISEETNTCQTK